MGIVYIIGIVGFLVLVLISRFVNENAMKLLDTDEKARLLDGFSNMRKYYLVPLIILIALFFLVIRYFPEWNIIIFSVYLGLLGIFLTVSAVYTFRKLKKLEMPPNYISMFLKGRVFQYIGAVLLFAALIYDMIFL